jgi:hypothetical protein
MFAWNNGHPPVTDLKWHLAHADISIRNSGHPRNNHSLHHECESLTHFLTGPHIMSDSSSRYSEFLFTQYAFQIT